jgi:hypothetical protein
MPCTTHFSFWKEERVAKAEIYPDKKWTGKRLKATGKYVIDIDFGHWNYVVARITKRQVKQLIKAGKEVLDDQSK